MLPRFALGACFGSTRLDLDLKNGWDGMGWDQLQDEKECSWGAEEPRREREKRDKR